MSLGKIFALYTVCFLGVTILIGLAEKFLGLSPQWIGWIFMALSLGIYIVIGIVTRTSNPDQYYVAGRGVPAVFNGMATGSDWMSAASFISMAGALSAQGFAGLAYVMGWTGGYLLLAVFLGPYLRQFGARDRRDRRDLLLIYLFDRAGYRRRLDRVTFHWPGFSNRRLCRFNWRALLLGSRRYEVGHLDSGSPVYHLDRFVFGARGLSFLPAFLDPRPRIDLRACAANQ
jgi:hypothetical protein